MKIVICGKNGGNIPSKKFVEILQKLNNLGYVSKSGGSVLDIPKNPQPEKRFLHINTYPHLGMNTPVVSFGTPLLLTPILYQENSDGSTWYEVDYFLKNF
jgi:hypothetical protein